MIVTCIDFIKPDCMNISLSVPLFGNIILRLKKSFFVERLSLKNTHQGTVFFTFWFNNINGRYQKILFVVLFDVNRNILI